ncbi:Membrane protein involved in the export of O-antigen and teichoic acid [Ruminococcaceae bacterium FB2012]|nr:Membrane protein involved in the export of O-antigen and teichoic acid [Ruminococcaceae bacterium FB2012]
MSKAKLFIENFLVYGFGGIISKIIPLIMVPIVTRIMPNTEYYGLSDLSHTVVSLASALAVMGMYDAMYRLFFEKDDEEYKKDVCSTALAFTIITSVIVFILLILFKDVIAQYFFENKEYAYVVYFSAIATLVGATNSIISAPTRMQNKRKVFLITNTVSPVISYAISIPMLLAGLYIIALPLAAIISGVTMEISFYVLNHRWFDVNRFDKKLLKQMLVIAIPLMPNFLIYWIFNSSDKVMITNIVGLGAAGIYAVGSKLGHVSQLIYTAFAGGWQFFAFSTMKEKDQVKTNSLIFEYLGIISFVVTYFVCAFSCTIFKILFKEEYYSGYIIAPYLFLAPLLQMLFQVAANQFLVIKKTWPNLFILLFGAIVNVILNLFLIRIIGIEGASIATLCGYAVSDIICVIVLCKMNLMTVSRRFIIAVFITIIYFVFWRLIFSDKLLIGLLAATLAMMMVAILYLKEIKMITRKIKNMRGKKA